MSQVLSTVTDVLHELRIDLQEFFWLVAQQLNIDAFPLPDALQDGLMVCCPASKVVPVRVAA